MTTAEEWSHLLPLQAVKGARFSLTLQQMQQIQLDAMKEGMRRAASVKVSALGNDLRSEGIQATRKAILTAVEQLTEKDLK